MAGQSPKRSSPLDDAPVGMGRVAGRVVTELERMIVTGELLPGQPIRQELMAERLGVSRLPIREGLRHLTAEGLVAHVPNVGYTVARLEQSEFDQIYLMRAALEPEVLRSLPRFGTTDLEDIRESAAAVAAASDRADLLDMRLKNQAFHFAMFDRSLLRLVVAELRRLWTLAMPYHAVYLFDPAARERVLTEHDAMIDALAVGDNERLIALMAEHRHGGESGTAMVLQTGSQAAHTPPT